MPHVWEDIGVNGREVVWTAHFKTTSANVSLISTVYPYLQSP